MSYAGVTRGNVETPFGKKKSHNFLKYIFNQGISSLSNIGASMAASIDSTA